MRAALPVRHNAERCARERNLQQRVQAEVLELAGVGAGARAGAVLGGDGDGLQRDEVAVPFEKHIVRNELGICGPVRVAADDANDTLVNGEDRAPKHAVRNRLVDVG